MRSIIKKQFISGIQDRELVSDAFLVKFTQIGTGKNGKPYMNLILIDRTGEIESKIWDNVGRFSSQVVKNAYVYVEGTVQMYQNRKQLVIKSIEVLRSDEVEENDFIKESHLDYEALYRKVLSFVDSMEDPYYKALAESVLRDDGRVAEGIKKAPAAKSIHHAYRSGLIEHMVSITEMLDFLSRHYAPYLDRDLLFLGGFFHDIGKIWELEYEKTTDYTDEGRLIGHLVMGVELVEAKIRLLESEPGRLPGPFPTEKKLLVKHVILAHHGKLEYGSPKEPHCLEALIVHMIDDLDSKVNAIRVFTENDTTAGSWTALHKGFNRFFFKPSWGGKPIRR